MKNLIYKVIPMILLGTVVFYACKKADDIDNTPPVENGPTLYDRLGGTTLISDPVDIEQTIEQGRLMLRSVVDSSIYVIAADPKMAPYFDVLLREMDLGKPTGFSALSEELTDFFCELTGSKNPEYAYSGLNMKDAHDPNLNNRMGFPANTPSFNKFVSNVVKGLAKNGVEDDSVVGEFALLLNGLKDEVVQTEEDPSTKPDATLYDKLGGIILSSDPIDSSDIEQGRLNLRSIVDSAIFIIAADPKLTPYFEILLMEIGDDDMSGFTALSENLTDFLCVETGATNPNYAYSGMNMVDAHNPDVNSRMALKANDEAFDQFITNMIAGAAQNSITDAVVIGELEQLLEDLRPKVVQTTENPLTLYDKLGGDEMVADPAGGMIEEGRLSLRSVVDSAIFIIAADPQMQPFFDVLLSEIGASDFTGLSTLSENLTDFFCEESGATNPAYAYSGLNMVDAHDPGQNSRMGEKAGDSDFDKFKNHIVAGAAQSGITDAAIVGQLEALIEASRSDVVQK